MRTHTHTHARTHNTTIRLFPAPAGLVVPFIDVSQQGTVTFNRMASVARGRLLVLISPDDLLRLSGTGSGTAPHCEWLRQVMSLYGRVPQVG